MEYLYLWHVFYERQGGHSVSAIMRLFHIGVKDVLADWTKQIRAVLLDKMNPVTPPYGME